jgi:hypothetical protein
MSEAPAFIRRGKIVYGVYLVAMLATAILVAEFLVLPRWIGLPRAALLMQFAAVRGYYLDDTPINEMGFVGDVLQRRKPPGTVRILTLGGSSLFNRRMAFRLHSGLQSLTDRRVELLGGALRTHTTASSLLKYEYLSEYAFDFVVVYHAINDLWVNHYPAKAFRDDYSHFDASYARGFLRDRSVIVRLLYNRLFWWPPPRVDNGASYRSEVSFRRNLGRIIEAVRSDGGTAILMTFASQLPDDYSAEAFWNRRLDYDTSDSYDRSPVSFWGSPQYVREGLERHNAIIRDLAADQQVLLMDAERLMAGNPKWFGDVCHFSEAGTDVFVGHVVAFFEEKRLLASPQVP